MSESAAAAPAPSTPQAPSAPASAPPTDPANQSPGTQAAPKDAKTQSSPPAKPELYEVKVDGKTVRMTKEELIQNASLGHASDSRFREAAQMRKDAEKMLGRLRDPKAAIELLQDPALGLSKDQVRAAFEEWYSKEFIEPDQLTPEQKRLRDAESQIKKYQDEEKQRSDQKLKDEQDAMTSQARETIQKQIIDALENSGLPKTNFTIRRLAYWMKRNNDNGYDAPTEVIVGQVRNEMNTNLRDLVEASDGDVLISILGDNVIKKLRKYDLEQLRKSRQQPLTPTQDSPGHSSAKAERPLTSSEVTQRIRQLQQTGKY